ncbi:MAG: SusC/RagA family TonB-linked outer membrane protein [Candidatus Cyclobacteriaceae bacterium M3_2C_046]
MSVKEVVISINLRNASILETFRQIERQTDFVFNYDLRHLENQKPININANSTTVADILLKISEKADLKFKQVNNSINVEKLDLNQKRKKVEKLEILIQARHVTGTVTSFEDGTGLPGVNVVEKGTRNGTVTDVQGDFALDVSEGATLIFSSVGYTTEEIAIGNRSVLDLVMSQDIQQLQELVVVGYGTQKKSDISAAISSIDGEEIAKVPVTSFDNAIQGRIPGVVVNSNSGQPGGVNSVRIRGLGGLNNSEPLYVIDGVIVENNNENSRTDYNTPLTNALATLNPQDIESITILKDASATALYGSRAGNGVVLITTKRGKSGQAKLNMDAYVGIQTVDKRIDLMNAAQFAKFSNEARIAAGLDPNKNWTNPENLGEGTDYQDAVFRTAPIQNYQLSASGGNENSVYFLSAGYMDQEGVVLNSNFERYSLRVNTDNNINKNIKIGNSLLLSHSISNNTNSGIMSSVLRRSPTIPVNHPDGIHYAGPSTYNAIYTGRAGNPVREAETSLRESFRNRILGNVYLEAEIIPGLTFKTNLGLDYTFTNTDRFDPTYQELPVQGTVINQDTEANAENRKFHSSNILLENTLNYNRKFGEKHNIAVLVGYTAQKIEDNVSTARSQGHRNNNLTTVAAGETGTTRFGSEEASAKTYASILGRINYNFDEKYILSANIRRDGSSIFSSQNKYAVFPSFSAAWRLSEEAFLNTLAFVSDLKLRFSWGQTGIDGGLGYGPHYDLLGSGFNYSLNGNEALGYAPVILINNSLKWEVATQTDIGIDLGLFEDKLQFTADYFVKDQTDVITSKVMPRTIGVLHMYWLPAPIVQQINSAQVLNKGIEMALNYRNYQNEWKYSLGLNFTAIDNEITKLENPESTNEFFGTHITRREEGYPLDAFYAYQSEGIIWDANDPALERQPKAELGDLKFADVNQDGVIDSEDRTFVGYPLPDFSFGFNGGLNFRNFDLNIMFQGVSGNEIYNVNMVRLLSSADGDNKSALMTDRWSQENPQGNYPRAHASDPNDNRRNSDRFVEDGSYLRLRNIEMGYSLPENVMSRLFMSRARVYISAQNLFTLTDYSGYNPDIALNGIDNGIYPQAKTYTIGANLSF